MKIPVEVQPPCEPHKATMVGWQSEDLTPEEVAARVGVPEGCFLEGKIMRRKGERRWSIVANVRIVVNTPPGVCPHCHGTGRVK